ncbi:hypothetical protein KC359_g114 [Hortaea werneckii]|nr:hypothetical protein KC359_g114 [Hortaea werneckii]
MLRFRSFQFLLKCAGQPFYLNLIIEGRLQHTCGWRHALGHQLARHASGIVAKVLHVTSEAQRTRDVRRGRQARQGSKHARASSGDKIVPTSKRALAARQRSHQRIHVLRVGAATNIINKEPIPPPRR